MPNYAIIQDNRVINVIVAESKEFAEELTNATAVEVIDGVATGIDWVWDGVKFIRPYVLPQPCPSWTLDETNTWQPPIPMPTDREGYLWNTQTLSWYIPEPVEVTND